jgi:hypothetical protein
MTYSKQDRTNSDDVYAPLISYTVGTREFDITEMLEPPVA